MKTQESEFVSEETELLKNEAEKSKNTWTGICTAVLVVLSNVSSAVTVQLIQHRIPDFELNTFRMAIPFVIYCIVNISYVRKWPTIDISEIPYIGAYISCLAVSSVAHYTAYAFLPLTSVTCLSDTIRMFSGIFLFSLCLAEEITLKRLLGAFICVVGITFVVQPPYIFERASSIEKQPFKVMSNTSVITDANISNVDHMMYKWENYTIAGKHSIAQSETPISEKLPTMARNSQNKTNARESTEQFPMKKHGMSLRLLGYLLPVIGGFARVSEIIVAKRRPYIIDHIMEVLFWSFLVNAAMSVVVSFSIETPAWPQTYLDWGLVFVHGLSYAILFPLFTYTAGHLEGNTLNLMLSLGTVLMLLAQYTLLANIEPGHRNWMEIFGVLMVLFGISLGSLISMFSERLKFLSRSK